MNGPGNSKFPPKGLFIIICIKYVYTCSCMLMHNG